MNDCAANRNLELCCERSLAINALARSAGVPPSTVNSILNGASKNSGVVTIQTLCDGLGISVVGFFDTEEFRKLEQEIR